MDETNQQSPQSSSTAPVASAQPQPVTPTPNSPIKKGTPVWVWILGGCLTILVLTLIAIVALGWWGVKKVKKEVELRQPQMEEIQKDIERMNKDAQEWEEETEKIKEKMPKVEDLPGDMQSEGE